MKKTLIISTLIGLIVGSSYFFLNSSFSLIDEAHKHEVNHVNAVLDTVTDEEVMEMAEVIFIGKTKEYHNIVNTPGDIPFTEVEFKVEEVIFSDINKEIPKDFRVFHEGSEDYFYDRFRLPERGVNYLVFLNYSEDLQGYQIKYQNSKLEVLKVNGDYRVVEPGLKKELEKLHGHKNYEDMDEFKDDVYVTSKSTNEKVKLTATEKLTEKKQKIKEIKEKE